MYDVELEVGDERAEEAAEAGVGRDAASAAGPHRDPQGIIIITVVIVIIIIIG